MSGTASKPGGAGGGPTFSRALERVTRTPEGRARWLLDFAAKDLVALSEGDWLNLEAEVGVFMITGQIRNVPLAKIHFPEDMKLMPYPRADIRKWHAWLRRGVSKLTQGQVWGVRSRATHCLQVGSSLSFGVLRTFHEVFIHGVLELFRPIWGRVRPCQECGRLFVSRKRQAYCTPACSQKFRTRKFRTARADRVRERRRAAYRHRQRSRYGPNVKIGRRAKGRH